MWQVQIWAGRGWAGVAECHRFSLAWSLVQEYRREGHLARVTQSKDNHANTRSVRKRQPRRQ